MNSAIVTFIVIGEVLTVGNIDAEVSIMQWSEDEIVHVKKTLRVEDFPCNPYPSMLFYYTANGKLRCGEPEPN